MRITVGLAAMASLCLLAGCNKGAANNSANAPAPAANAAAPAAPVETPAPAVEEIPIGPPVVEQMAMTTTTYDDLPKTASSWPLWSRLS